MPEKKNEDYFVGISEPVKVRKSILESSRSVIQSLHRFERFKVLRQKKGEQIHKLNAVMKEIKSLAARLRMELPKLPQQPKKKPGKEAKEERKQLAPERKQPQKPDTSPRIKSELERLEEELDNVERKLAGLE